MVDIILGDTNVMIDGKNKMIKISGDIINCGEIYSKIKELYLSSAMIHDDMPMNALTPFVYQIINGYGLEIKAQQLAYPRIEGGVLNVISETCTKNKEDIIKPSNWYKDVRPNQKIATEDKPRHEPRYNPVDRYNPIFGAKALKALDEETKAFTKLRTWDAKKTAKKDIGGSHPW